MADEYTVESALTELREWFPGEIFKVETEEAVRMDETGKHARMRKSALILQVTRGLEGFYTGETLDDCMAQVKKWREGISTREGK